MIHIIDLTMLTVLGVSTVLISLVIMMMVWRRSRAHLMRVELFGGSYNLSEIRKFRPDAYAITIDVDNKTVFWVPLRYQGGYYTFKLKGRVGTFVPVERGTLTVDGKPCFVAVRMGDASLELSPELSAKLKASILKSDDMRKLQSKSFLVALHELYESTTQNVFTDESTAREELLLDITPTNLYISMVEYLTHAASNILTSINALGSTAFETGGALERLKGVQPREWGAFLVYIAVAVVVVMLFFGVMKFVGFM
ncbi:MAG: hypothetical protein QXO22_04245 [Thermosphaera sp.]